MMSGIDAAHARISEIQARLRMLSTSTVGGPVGTQGPAAPGNTFEQVVNRVAAPATASPAAAPTPAPAPGRTAAAASAHLPVPVGTTPGDWAQRLPAAGRSWAGAIEQAANRHGLDPALLAALVWTESGFQPDARSHAGAVGLSQLMPATAAGLGVDPHDPAQNLDGGARFLRAQLDRFGSADLALAAYNAGPARVAQAGGIPRIAETQAYVPKVLGRLAHLKGTP